MEIQAVCPHCKKVGVAHWKEKENIFCPLCQHPWLEFVTEKFIDQCAMCGAAHLYRQKDFNRKLGVGLVVLGVAFAYFTYGISLLVVTLVDWLLFKRVGEVGCCYRCNTQYRKSSRIDEMAPFDLELQDYYRNLR